VPAQLTCSELGPDSSWDLRLEGLERTPALRESRPSNGWSPRRRRASPVVAESRLTARRMAVELFQVGMSQVEVARRTGMSRITINQWFGKYRAGGADQVMRIYHPAGRRPRLDEPQLASLRQALLLGPLEHGFRSSRWTRSDMVTLIARLFGVSFARDSMPKLLHSAGLHPGNCPSLTRPPRRERGPRGRPRRLSFDQVRGLAPSLRKSPGSSGLSGSEWTTELVAELMKARFGVVYSPDYIRDLLRGARMNPDSFIRWKKRVLSRRRGSHPTESTSASPDDNIALRGRFPVPQEMPSTL
jgi:transposase